MPKKGRRIKRSGKYTQKKKKTADRTLLFLIATILLFGIIMIYDATVVYSQETFGGAYRFVILHIAWVAVGLLGFNFFYRVDYEKSVRSIAFPMFVGTLLILIFLAGVSFLPCSDNDVIFAPCINGARRWVFLNPPPLPEIPILGILGFQPSELAKFSLIMYLAVIVSKHFEDKYTAFMITVVATGLTAFLILLQPNLSTAFMIVLVGLVLYFASGSSVLPLVITTPIAAILGVLFIFTSSYRKERLFTFLEQGESGDLTAGYHIKQILIALGSGGIFGVGFGQSRQKFQYLPEVASDSIFAIIGEELGFVGTTLFILLFSFLIYKGYSIAKNSKDLLGRLLAVGITTWMAVQFFTNIAAMTKLIPLTGIPIPLISYGGSSTVFSLMGLGLLANISRSRS